MSSGIWRRHRKLYADEFVMAYTELAILEVLEEIWFSIDLFRLIDIICLYFKQVFGWKTFQDT